MVVVSLGRCWGSKKNVPLSVKKATQGWVEMAHIGAFRNCLKLHSFVLLVWSSFMPSASTDINAINLESGNVQVRFCENVYARARACGGGGGAKTT